MQPHQQKFIIANESAIIEICRPLHRYFENIDVFTFCRYFYDHHILTLSTNKSPYIYFLDKCKNFIMPFPNQLTTYDFHYVITDEGPYSQVLHEARSYFGIAGGLNLVNVTPSYCDFFGFCLNTGQLNTVNSLIAQIDLLKNFCIYFKEKANNILQTSNKNLVKLNSLMHLDLAPIQALLNNKTQLAFLDEITLDHYSMNINGVKRSISKTEWLCLRQLGQGMKAKEAAKMLKLSPHSVHTYIRNLKQKFACQTKTQLLHAFKQHFPYC